MGKAIPLLRNLSLLCVLAIVVSTIPVIRAETQHVAPTQWGGSTSFGSYPSTIQLSQSFNITVHAEWYGLDLVNENLGRITGLTISVYIIDDSGYKEPSSGPSCGGLTEVPCSAWFLAFADYPPCNRGFPSSSFTLSCTINYTGDTGHADITFHVESVLGTPGYEYRIPPMSKTPTTLWLGTSMDAVIIGGVVGIVNNLGGATIKVSTSATQSKTSESVTSVSSIPTVTNPRPIVATTTVTTLVEVPNLFYESYAGWVVALVLAAAVAGLLVYMKFRKQKK